MGVVVEKEEMERKTGSSTRVPFHASLSVSFRPPLASFPPPLQPIYPISHSTH
jgi:hypothetical protein